jgi:hypothetical protein
VAVLLDSMKRKGASNTHMTCPSCRSGLRVVNWRNSHGRSSGWQRCGHAVAGFVASAEPQRCVLSALEDLDSTSCRVEFEGIEQSLAVLGPFLDEDLRQAMGLQPQSFRLERSVVMSPAQFTQALSQAKQEHVHKAEPGPEPSGDDDGLQWVLHSAHLQEKLREASLLAQQDTASPNSLSMNHTIMVTVDSRTSEDTWVQLDMRAGPLASAMSQRHVGALLDPVSHVPGRSTAGLEDIRRAARVAALRRGDFRGSAAAESKDEQGLMGWFGTNTSTTPEWAHDLCRSGGQHCITASAFRDTLRALRAPLLRSSTGVNRDGKAWATSDDIGQAISRMLGGTLQALVSGKPLPDVRTWLSKRLERSMPGLPPSVTRLLRRSIEAAGALLGAVSDEHAARRAQHLLKTQRFASARRSVAMPTEPPNGTIARVFQAMGLDPRYGGLRSHQDAEAALLQSASRRLLHEGSSDVGGYDGLRSHQDAEAALLQGAGSDGNSFRTSHAKELLRSAKQSTLSESERDRLTGRHAAALSGMLLETESTVRGLLQAGVTAREVFACVVDQIMNSAPEIMVQMIINIVRQPFADLLAMVIPMILPPLMVPVPAPKIIFPGPDAGSNPKKVPLKCECVVPPSPASASAMKMPPMPDFASMMPFPMLLQERGVDPEELWRGVSNQETSPAGGIGASGSSLAAAIDPPAAVAEPPVPVVPGKLPDFVWDLQSIPSAEMGHATLAVTSGAETVRSAVQRANTPVNTVAYGEPGLRRSLAEPRYREKVTVSRDESLAKLDVATDAAVERALRLGAGSEAAIHELMRLGAEHAQMTGEMELARLRARAALASRVGSHATVGRATVERLGLSTYEGSKAYDRLLGEERCSCALGSLRVSPEDTPDDDVPTRPEAAEGGERTQNTADKAPHPAPERPGGVWYPGMHEEPPPSVQHMYESHGTGVLESIRMLQRDVDSLVPRGVSTDVPKLSPKTEESVSKAIKEASTMSVNDGDTSHRFAATSRLSADRESRQEAERVNQEMMPQRTKLQAKDLIDKAMRAARTASPLDSGDPPALTQEEFGGILPADADSKLLQTNERISPRRRRPDGGVSIPSPFWDSSPTMKTTSATTSATTKGSQFSLLQAKGDTKGGPVSHMMPLIHRNVVAGLLTLASPAAKDQAIAGIMARLPDLATRQIVLAIAPHLVPRLTAGLTGQLMRELVPRVLARLTQRLTQRLTKELTPRLATSLGLTLARSLTRDPSADFECQYCFHQWDSFKKGIKDRSGKLKEWEKKMAAGKADASQEPWNPPLPAYCTPCLTSIQVGEALDELVQAYVGDAAEFYSDYYSSEGQSFEMTARALRDTVREARAEQAVPEVKWEWEPKK